MSIAPSKIPAQRPGSRSNNRKTPKPLRILFASWLIFGLLGSIWALASPIMSIPDEPAHAIKAAAVARGQISGTDSGVQGERLTVTVPGYIEALNGQTCYASRTDLTAACAPPLDANDRGATSAQTSAGNYNPLYYGLVGLASRGISGDAAVYGMRLLSVWMSAFFLAAMISSASSLRRHVLPVAAAAVAVTPNVLFLSAGINPNALEIATAGSLFIGLCAVMEKSRDLSTARLQIWLVGLSGALLACTRPISLLWLAIAVVSAVLAYGLPALWRVLSFKGTFLPLGLVVASSAFALWWLVSAKSLDSLLGGAPIPADVSAVSMLDHTFIYVQHYVGVLGWLDTLPPPAVLFTWVFGFAVVLFTGMTSRPVRGRWSVALPTLVVLIAPIALQASVSEQLGQIWQGRYIQAILVVLLLACGVAARFRPIMRTPRTESIIRWSIVLGALGHVYLFLEGLRRYTIGTANGRVNWSEMFEPAWQPPLTWQGLTLLYVALLVVAGVCLYRLLCKPQRQQVRHARPAGQLLSDRVAEPVAPTS